MINTSKYSTDVESMTINDNGYSWERQRTSGELQNFIERHLSIVGELDAVDYELAV